MEQFYGKKEVFVLIFCVCVSLAMASSEEETVIETSTHNSTVIVKRNFNYTVVEKCESNVPCVRFCCTKSEKCDKFDPENKKFDLSNFTQASALSSDYLVVFGRPCENMFEADSNWTLLEVNKFKIILFYYPLINICQCHLPRTDLFTKSSSLMIMIIKK